MSKTSTSPHMSRRGLIRAVGAGAAALGLSAGLSTSAEADDFQVPTITREWDKTFPKSDRVRHEKVSYVNRLGIRLVADLYSPKNASNTARRRGLIIGHPFGGVKEQSSGLYAQTLAERGFVTLAHDASYNGESGGQPHHICSPEAFVEDFSAGVDYLHTLPTVNPDAIGAIGVCASGGFVLAAAEVDPRIKAVATSVMYDMGSERREGLGRTLSPNDLKLMLRQVSEQRNGEFVGGELTYVGMPDVLPPDAPPVALEFYSYYRTARGRHPRSIPGISFTSNMALVHFRPLDHLELIAPRPVLLVTGEHAHSRYFSEEAFAKAQDPKEFHVVPGAGHVDLYDQVKLIPWDTLQSFFERHLPN